MPLIKALFNYDREFLKNPGILFILIMKIIFNKWSSM